MISWLKTTPIFLTLFLIFVAHGYTQRADDSLSAYLDQFLDLWHRYAAEANHSAYTGAMTPDGVFIGTDPTERWTTSEFSSWSRPYFERKRTWDFRATNRHITLSDDGRTAWFDELLTTQMGLCRGSGVLVRQDGTWKIAQYVLSPTVPNPLMKQVTAIKGSSDTSLILRGIFTRHGLDGTLLLHDPSKGSSFGYNPALWDSGYLPASTFKVPNLLIALELGTVDTNHIFRWDGKKQRLPQWEKDLTLAEAFRVSCVPCFQELARKTGPQRMKEYLAKFGYPGMDVNQENIDLFWLEGGSRITPRQQVTFLKRLNEETLPLKPGVIKTMKRIMTNEKTKEYTLCGKTGWAIRDGNNYGWFVGWIESGGTVLYLATLVTPGKGELPDDFAAARKGITMDVLRLFRIIPGH